MVKFGRVEQGKIDEWDSLIPGEFRYCRELEDGGVNGPVWEFPVGFRVAGIHFV